MADTEAEVADRKVRLSHILMEQWSSRDTHGNRLSWDWGEPDADGFYTPSVTIDYDDNIVAAERARLAEGVRALPQYAFSLYDDGTDDRITVSRAAVLDLLEQP